MSYTKLPARYPGMYRQEPVEVEGQDYCELKWVPIQAKKKKEPYCQVSFCSNVSEKHSSTGRSLLCSTCRVRLWRANNPIRAIYNALKNKARRRKIPFSLTMEHFAMICEETDYHLTRGRRNEAMQLDRKDAMKGYEDGNVQVMVALLNRQKGVAEETRSPDEWEQISSGGTTDDLDWQPFRVKGDPEDEDDDLPF